MAEVTSNKYCNLDDNVLISIDHVKISNGFTLVDEDMKSLQTSLSYIDIDGGPFDGNIPIGPMIDGGTY